MWLSLFVAVSGLSSGQVPAASHIIPDCWMLDDSTWFMAWYQWWETLLKVRQPLHKNAAKVQQEIAGSDGMAGFTLQVNPVAYIHLVPISLAWSVFFMYPSVANVWSIDWLINRSINRSIYHHSIDPLIHWSIIQLFYVVCSFLTAERQYKALVKIQCTLMAENCFERLSICINSNFCSCAMFLFCWPACCVGKSGRIWFACAR